ncbi:MAG: hypothetical protein H7099_06990 [Gemmatimonadaceae bacterium]|nr:hypothetical protein [Gemmatimonadaceae bacterium]
MRTAHGFVIPVLLAVFAERSQAQASAKDRGVTFGLAIGAASVSLEPPTRTTGTDIAIGWRVGYRMSPRAAVVLNGISSVYAWSGGGRPRKRGFEGLMPSVQYWLAPRLWVSAGAGLNLDAPAFYDIRSGNAGERDFHAGLGAVGIIGGELMRRGGTAIELQTRLHSGYMNLPDGRRRGTTASLLIGLSR